MNQRGGGRKREGEQPLASPFAVSRVGVPGAELGPRFPWAPVPALRVTRARYASPADLHVSGRWGMAWTDTVPALSPAFCSLE